MALLAGRTTQGVVPPNSKDLKAEEDENAEIELIV